MISVVYVKEYGDVKGVPARNESYEPTNSSYTADISSVLRLMLLALVCIKQFV